MKHFDVIVIGSGISGLNFALRAAENGERVLVITKKKIAQSGTNFAQGGIAAVLSKVDDFKRHVQDTLVAGCFHNKKRAVEYMVKHGPIAITRLIELGVPFATHHGELLLTREGGHSSRRIAFVSDYTGQAIERVLVSKARKNPHITLLEHTFAVDLLMKKRICYGVQILRGKKFENVYANFVVLATGGIGQLFARTTNPNISTGDGLAMAARAGCQFRDLEFVQFHPTCFISSAIAQAGNPRDPAFAWPARSRRALADRATMFLISEAVRGEGAYLRNSKGERFMKKIHKLAELAPRDIVSRAIFHEEQSGPVFLDLRHKTRKELETRFPQIYQKLKSYGLDMEKDLIPISPAAHYLCGGIAVNLRGETGIKNLYAFGEVSGTGVHGANRLASNSLLEALVFSDRILRIKKSRAPGRISFPKTKWQSLTSHEKTKLAAIRKTLKKTMWECVGIVRSTKLLKQALYTLAALKMEIPKKANQKILELKNMISAAALITKAALARRKSLGCHFRVD